MADEEVEAVAPVGLSEPALTLSAQPDADMVETMKVWSVQYPPGSWQHTMALQVINQVGYDPNEGDQIQLFDPVGQEWIPSEGAGGWVLAWRSQVPDGRVLVVRNTNTGEYEFIDDSQGDSPLIFRPDQLTRTSEALLAAMDRQEPFVM